jgi:hypothetical protein
MANQVLQKSLLRLDFYNSKPQIVAKKYIAPIHLGEYSTTSLSMDIIVCNYAFYKYH